MAIWQNFNIREKILVGLLLPLILMLVFYLYLWQPTKLELGKLRLAVPQDNATLAWMKFRLNDGVVNSDGEDQAGQNKPLLTVIEKVAIDTGIKNSIQRVQPGESGVVEIWFQEVVADQLFAWIDQLAVNGISVDSAAITRAIPGRVSARIKVIRR